MNIATVLKTPMALPLIATLVLAGCGGGGGEAFSSLIDGIRDLQQPQQDQGGGQQSQGGNQQSQGGNQQSQGGNQQSQGGNQQSQGGNQQSQGGNQQSQGGNQQSQGGNQQSQGGNQQRGPAANAQTAASAYRSILNAGYGGAPGDAIAVGCHLTNGECFKGNEYGVELNVSGFENSFAVLESLTGQGRTPGYAGLTGDHSDFTAGTFGGWGDWTVFGLWVEKRDSTSHPHLNVLEWVVGTATAAAPTLDCRQGAPGCVPGLSERQDLGTGTATYKGATVASYLFNDGDSYGTRGVAWGDATIRASFSSGQLEALDARFHNFNHSAFPDFQIQFTEFFSGAAASYVSARFGGPNGEEVVGNYVYVLNAADPYFPEAPAAIIGAYGAEKQ